MTHLRIIIVYPKMHNLSGRLQFNRTLVVYPRLLALLTICVCHNTMGIAGSFMYVINQPAAIGAAAHLLQQLGDSFGFASVTNQVATNNAHTLVIADWLKHRNCAISLVVAQRHLCSS